VCAESPCDNGDAVANCFIGSRATLLPELKYALPPSPVTASAVQYVSHEQLTGLPCFRAETVCWALTRRQAPVPESAGAARTGTQPGWCWSAVSGHITSSRSACTSAVHACCTGSVAMILRSIAGVSRIPWGRTGSAGRCQLCSSAGTVHRAQPWSTNSVRYWRHVSQRQGMLSSSSEALFYL
jgi:hypothetical protein